MTDRTDDPILDPEDERVPGNDNPKSDISPTDPDVGPESIQDNTWAPLADPPGVSAEEDPRGMGEPLPANPGVVDDEEEFADPLAGEAVPSDDEPGRALPPPVLEPLPVDSSDELASTPVVEPVPDEEEVPEPGDESFVPLTTTDTTQPDETSEPGEPAAGPEIGQAEASPEPPASEAAGATAAASGFLGGLKERFRAIGSGNKEAEVGPGDRPEPEQAATASRSTRMANAVRGYFDPRLSQYATRPHRWVLGVSAVVILLSLLAGSGGLALVMLSVIAPLLIVISLTQLDVFEKESNLIVAGVIAAGAVTGIVLGAIASWIQGEQWFDTGKLNFGAGGFSGPFADIAGSPPVVVWLVSGVVLGAVGTAAIGGAAVALRRFPQFRNEAMDSVIIGGAAAAGFVIGLSLVYWWPMVGDPGPVTSVQDWTLRIIGVGILRPAAFTLCGALLGFGVWLYATNRSFSVAGVPALLGGLGLFLLSLVPTTLQASGAWSEVIVTAILFAVAFPAYRFALDNAIAIDRQALGDEGNRIVCPACGKVTPLGDFCAHCGQRLRPTDGQTVETSPGG
jgi:hypothetical protein